MITPFQVYLVMMADKFCDSFCGGFFLSAMVLLLSLGATFLFWDQLDKDGQSFLKNVRNFSGLLVLIFGILTTVTPDTKTLATMYLAPAIVNSEAIQKDVPEIYNLAVEKLKETMSSPKAEK